MMKTVVLKSFAGKLPDKIHLVQLLVQYDRGSGLKVAKEKVDQLVLGKSVPCVVEESALADFEQELTTMKITHETT